MRRTLLTFLLTVGMFGLLPASAAATAAATTGSEPVDASWLDRRTVDLTFEVPGLSSVLPRPKVRVLLPKGYRDSARRYPVLLLLHGAGDRYDGWTTNQDGWPVTLKQFTADKDVIVVMPDGGTPDRPGWYSDWFNFGNLGSPRWETFHIKTVLPYIFRTFRAERDRDSHVVAGLSMGGFGAMSYAARHPDLFAGAFSLSGALDNRRFMSHAFPEVWGTEADQLVRVRGHNPVDLVGNLRHTRLWFRTGQGVPGGPAPRDNEPQGLALEQGVGKLNEIFAAALERAGLPYTYQSYAQGGHNWWHWQRGLQRLAWPEIEAVFAHDGPDRPRRFSYRSIEPRFGVWGWRVHPDREVVEFLRMKGVRSQGLRLVGSGIVDLRTPAVYEPGRRYRIDVEGATASTPTPVVHADQSGRLSFVVRLGDSHVHQQDTAPQRAAAAEPGPYWQAATVRISR